ncbi:uncharacterized protein LOC116298919 [Actinia tenebrosa]|uniref:Uncharacterized protein LOC116298919 n=1 Tax=Actinia tenebrosa TaxID=6105 RepID=A0A6P8I468_ACTTE|nr:uncharacterized protein LOC116298919 [Actinia tenebrosa]
MTAPRKVRTPLRAIGQVKRVKRRRGKIKSFDEEGALPKPDPSKVYLEDPIEIKRKNEGMTMDVFDFWDYLNRAYWKGRLRICDGDLMRKLIDCFDDLVQNKILAKVVTTRNFCRRDRDGGSVHSLFNEEEKQFWKEKALHVKATFTYYGGTPIKKHRKVSFATSPNTVFTPHIRHSLPIMKRRHDPLTADPKDEAISKLNTQFTSFFPRLGWDSNITCQSDTSEWFISPVSEDLATKCIKAAQDFLIIKEQFTDSETWRTVTSITISRKETRYKMYRVVKGMKSFYTSAEFSLHRYALEKRSEIPKSRGLFALRPRKKIEYVVATSRNPQLRRTVLPRIETETA